MEWMRNKQDSWHLARPDSKKGERYVKKSDKDEDGYFEGTGNQKTKRNRKGRQTEVTSTRPSLSLAMGPSSPPAVNAWSQKKGSALFKNPSEEVDEEDEMLKLALQESIKTAQEDQERHLERMKMTFNNKAYGETVLKTKEENRSEVDKTYCSSTSEDLHFVDVEEEPPPVQRRNQPSFRTKNLSYNNKKVAAVNKDYIKSCNFKSSPPEAPNQPKDHVEFPHENKVFPIGATNYDQIEHPLLTDTISAAPNLNKERENNFALVDGLSVDFSSNLTFGDTQRFSGHNYDKYNSHETNDIATDFHFNQFKYDEQKNSAPMSANKSLLPNGTSDLLGSPNDTDRMLHSFIRHDPPSLSAPASSSEITVSNNPLISSNSDTFQTQDIYNRFILDNSPLGFNIAPRPAETVLPFQNVNMYDSIRKDMSTGLPQNVQEMSTHNPNFFLPQTMMNVQNNPPEASANLQGIQSTTNSNVTPQILYTQSQQHQEAYRNLQELQLTPNTIVASQTLFPQTNQEKSGSLQSMQSTASRVPYPSVPPGYPLAQQSQWSTPSSSFNQLGYPNTHDLYQQAHLFSQTTTQTDQNNIEHKSDMSSRESQSPITQNQSQYQLQMLLALNNDQRNIVQNPHEIPNQNNHRITEQLGGQQPNKTREELQQEFLRLMQHVTHIQQQLANTEQDRQRQLYNLPSTYLPIPNNMSYPGAHMMPLAQQIVPSQVLTSSGQISPNAQYLPINRPEINTSTEIGLIPPTSNFEVSRERARLQ